MSDDISSDLTVAAEVTSDVGVEVDVLADIAEEVFFDGPDPDEHDRFDTEVIAGLIKRDAANPYANVPESVIRIIEDGNEIGADVVSAEWGSLNGASTGTEKVTILREMARLISEWFRVNVVKLPVELVKMGIDFEELRGILGVNDRTFRGVIDTAAVDFNGYLIPCKELFK